MANKNVKKNDHIVYDRKLTRNILKKMMKNNRIRNLWHQLKAEGKIGG